MGCVQAQDFAGAKWAIGSRLKNSTDASIEQQFNEGKILRTHILRPTWHFVAPADIRWMLALTAPRIKAFIAGYRRKLELDKVLFRRSNLALKKALKGRQLTRKELALVLQQAGIRTDEDRLGHLLIEAELDAIICSGAIRDKQFTYVLMDERVPETAPLKHEEALSELTLRYFKSRGPATLADFAWWSGLTIAEARIGLESHRSQYEKADLDGKTFWYHRDKSFLQAARSSGQKENSSLFALPAFDEYTIAYTHRDLVLHPKYAHKDGNGIFKPLLIRNGLIAGTWHRTIKKDCIIIDTDLFKPLANVRSGLHLKPITRLWARILFYPDLPQKLPQDHPTPLILPLSTLFAY
jgi:hypothetical protein